MNKKLFILNAFVLSSLLVGCNNSINNSDTIIIGTTMSIENAIRGEYNYDLLSSGCSNPPLIYQDENGTYQPLVATFSTNNSKTWTYTILNNLKWSDGVDVTAEDIIYTFNFLDAYEQGNYLKDYTYIDNEGNTIVDKKLYESYTFSNNNRTVSLTLVDTNIRILDDMITFRIMPKHIYENKELNELTILDKRISCGPFVLSNFNKNSNTLTFEKNEYYPDNININKLIYKLFSNEDTMYSALKNGDIDTTWIYSKGVGSTYINGLKNVEFLSNLSISTTAINGVLMFNTKSTTFSDINIRTSISYILDYEAFKETFGGDDASVANKGFAPKSCIGYKKTDLLSKNHEKAKEYLELSGYKKDGNYYKRDNKILSFELLVKSNKSDQIRMGEFVKTQLEEFGIKVILTTLSNSDFNSKISNKFSNNKVNFEACINGFTQAGMNMGDGLGSIYVDKNHSTQGGCQVDDEDFNVILNNMENSKNLEEYIGFAGNLQEYYEKNIPLIALYWDNNLYFYNNRLSNLVLDANFGINNAINWSNITLNK